MVYHDLGSCYHRLELVYDRLRPIYDRHADFRMKKTPLNREVLYSLTTGIEQHLNDPPDLIISEKSTSITSKPCARI